jgi:hypothetical protein
MVQFPTWVRVLFSLFHSGAEGHRASRPMGKKVKLTLYCQSQWPRGLRHELSSNAGIMGSNPTQGMDVYMCVNSVFMLSCV